MSGLPANLEAGLPRMTRHLARLFRLERVGRLERHSATMARRLIERRGVLIDTLIAAEHQRRAAVAAHPPALADALAELSAEIGRCRPSVERRLHELAAELRLRRGGAAPSGLRGSASGRLLGTS
jgi:hypothetical protein